MVREIAMKSGTNSNASFFAIRVRSCRLRGTRLVLQRDVFSSRRSGFVRHMVRHDKTRDGKSCAQKVRHTSSGALHAWCSLVGSGPTDSTSRCHCNKALLLTRAHARALAGCYGHITVMAMMWQSPVVDHHDFPASPQSTE
jgi:hypothetical protein